MRISRAELVRAILVSLPAVPLPAASAFIQADDKSWDVTLPSTWQLTEASKTPRAEEEHIFRIGGSRPGTSAQFELTVDFSERKKLSDLGSIESVAERFRAEQPQPARLLTAVKLPRADLFSSTTYEFRVDAANVGTCIQRVSLTQGRLYRLYATLPADAPQPLQQEVNDIVGSYKAFPLNIGCLKASNKGGSVLPGVCY